MTQTPPQTSPTPSTVLIAGIGPIPPREPDRLYAPGIRLWSLALATLRGGLETHVLEIGFGARGADEATLHRVGHTTDGEGLLESSSVTGASLRDIVAIARERSAATTIVSTTDLVGSACACAVQDMPFWCDLNGHPMAERQGLSHRYQSDEGLAPQWDDILPALLRADRFSTCSGPQRLALIGELGATGRLNRHSDGYPLVTALPVAYGRSTAPRPVESPLRGSLVPQDAFVVLWAGGYNTWADTATLREGLTRAMLQAPRIRFVSTGGAIDGHDDRTFDEFRKGMEASPVADRCHFAGWVPLEELDSYYALADVAVVCDRPTLEGELGSRNRVLDWVCAGIPIACTDICELTHEFAQKGHIDTFAPKDADGLADLLIRLSETPTDAISKRAEQAREFALEAHAPQRVYAPLVKWARHPERAPDLATSPLPGAPFAIPDNALARRRLREWQEARCPNPAPSFLNRIARRLSPGLFSSKEPTRP